MSVDEIRQNEVIAEPLVTAENNALPPSLFVAACLVVPIAWGVIVHLIFKRLRKKLRPDRPVESNRPEYEI